MEALHIFFFSQQETSKPHQAAWGRGSITICQGWFLEQTLSAPQKWEHCQWLFIQMSDVHVFLHLPAGMHIVQLGLDFRIASLMVVFPYPQRDSEGLSQPAKGHFKEPPSQ